MKSTLSGILMMSLTMLFLFSRCENKDENNPATPSSKFLGRYKSTQPILVKIKSDYCSLTTLEDVATIQWDVFWEVKETSDPNIVDIVMTYNSHNFTIVNSNCTSGAGYAPEPSPLYIKGYINGDALTIKYSNEEFGTFDFLNNNFEGTMKYSYCLLYCQEIYTDQDDFSVQKY